MNSNIVPKPLDYVKYLTKVRRQCKQEDDRMRIDIIVDGITDQTILSLNDVLIGCQDRLLYLNKVRPQLRDTDRSKIHTDSYGWSLRDSMRGLRFLSQFVERWKWTSLNIDERCLQWDSEFVYSLWDIWRINSTRNRIHFDNIGSLMLWSSYFILGKVENNLLMVLNLREWNGLGTIEKWFSSLCYPLESKHMAGNIQKMKRLKWSPLQIE